MTIDAILSQYGAIAVFLGAGIEGETVVVSGGFLAHQGLVPLAHVMIAAALGSFVADQIFFLLGRRFRDHPRIRRITARPAFARALSMLERHPVAFVMAFRFLYGLRTVSPVAIGTTTLPARRFLVLNAIAAVIWGVLFSLVGYVFGHGLELVFGKLRPLLHIVVPIGAIIVAAFVLHWFVRRHSTSEEER